MLKLGDRVEKVTGYKWPGVVVAIFKNLQGERRIVVECTAEAVTGALHIYSPGQLVKLNGEALPETGPAVGEASAPVLETGVLAPRAQGRSD